MPAKVLIVDDEKNILITLKRAFEVAGYQADIAGSGKLCLERLKENVYDVLLIDVKMPDLDGLSVLQQIRANGNDIPVLVMSGHGTIETAVQATKLGAHDFLEKPISTEKLFLTVENTLGFDQLKRENRALKREVEDRFKMIGAGPKTRALKERIQLAAPSQGWVLVTGENGSGKELIARAIHENSKRANGPFIKMNCAAVPHDLIESELFGHEKGSFTGASSQRKGKFERADEGTLFLDEVGDMPLAMQAKLLRVLQEGEIERIGGNETLRIDVRIIAATNKDLTKEIAQKTFREDLFYRLNVIPIEAPPLRDRKEDIPELVEHFLRIACRANDQPMRKFSRAALELLAQHDWPGNIRELKNSVERIVILTRGEEISEPDIRNLLPSTIKAASSTSKARYERGKLFKDLVADAEREILSRALEENKGHMTRTAQELGLERSHLYKKLKSLGLSRSDGEKTDDSDDDES
jgi:DNA-binding NtrC family response regulator